MAEMDVVRSLLRDGFTRTHEGVPDVVDGLTVNELLWQPDPDANHVAWLVWHLARQQDEQVAHLDGRESVWRAQDWADRFELPYRSGAQGYGMSGADVRAFRVTDPQLLVDYHGAVHAQTVEVIDALSRNRIGKVIDESWDPPVTVAVRIVSILDDAAKHLGQAEYVRGLLLRRRDAAQG